MASRESQGLQIALIIFVMVTVVLAVTTFVFYRKSEELKKSVADATAKEKSASDGLKKENFKVQYMMHILGASTLAEAELTSVRQDVLGDTVMKGVDDSFQQHMSTYGEGLPPEKRNYREMLPNMLMALQARNKANTDLLAEKATLNDEKKSLQESEAKRTGEAVANLQKAQNDLTTQVQQFEADRKSLEERQKSQLAAFTKSISDVQGKLVAYSKKNEERQGDVKKMENVIAEQRKALEEMRDEPFEIPDGLITWVNQRSGTVWINLGTADALRRQTLFSIFDQADNGVTRTERKASVEVTRVLDEHLSEARIVYDEPSNPIMPGDYVFSPAWGPGQRIHFALAGILDIDGDNRTDRELIRNLILSSGAVIDAEVTEDGQEIGKLTSSTRYLVVGDQPTERNDAKTLAAWGRITDDAKQMGVQPLPLKTLLSWMGYKREVRTVTLGEHARSQDQQMAPAEGRARTSTGNVSDVFRERRPPERGKTSSAF